MREIKFRAWDNETQLMYNNCGVDPNGIAYYIASEDNVEWLPDADLMQYTGLKDKNGVEIYEGDILEMKDHPIAGDIKGVIDWHEHRYGLGDKMGVGSGDGFEVIGNVFAHPELMDGK